MTTILSTSGPNYSVMLADQGITSDLMHPDMSKIVRQDTWLIALCGEDRVCDVVQYATKFPKPPVSLLEKKTDEWYPWIVTRVIPQIHRAIEENMHKSYWGTLGESEALITTHGHTFLVGSTLGITKAEPYWGIGSGSHLAMGALSQNASAADWKTKHGDYARSAIAVAQLHDPYTRGKITGYKSFSNGKIVVLP